MLFLAAQCSPPPTQLAAGNHEGHAEDAQVRELAAVNLIDDKKLKVVVTTNIAGDLVRNVGGDLLDLTTLLPIGADPHTFTPTPRDAATVAEAHIIFMNGLHLEEFLEELIENAGGDAPVVALSTNVETRQFDEEGNHREDDNAHQGADPHIWMSPTNAIIMVHTIEHALSTLDPANAEIYAANAKAYEAQLAELDAWVMGQIESIPTENRELVTDHNALGYYADRYGLKLVGAIIPAVSTSAEPSAADLAALQAAIAGLKAKAIFVGTTVNPKLAEQVARDSGLQLVPLYTGSLGQAGSGAESYLDLIRTNTIAIVEALK